jgi:nucleotide-binding universal stress UspA family protein
MEEFKMYRSILVPLDGSKRAEAILPHVTELAQRFEAKLILLGVVEPEPIIVAAEPVYTKIDEEVYERRVEQVRSYLESRCADFRRMGLPAQAEIGHGPVVECIINTAEKANVELLAMVSHGRTGLSRVFYGSVAAGVLHRIDRPLLLIRALD